MNARSPSALALAICLGIFGTTLAADDNTASSAAATPGPRVGTSAPGMPVTAQTLYAVVNADGTMARSLAVPAILKLGGAGTYEVQFNKNVTKCAYVATIGLSGAVGQSVPGFVTVVGRAGNANAVFLQTFDATGALTDLGFHIAAHC